MKFRRLKNYQKRFTYAEEVSFDDVINTAIELIENLRQPQLRATDQFSSKNMLIWTK